MHDLGKATKAFDHYLRSQVGLLDPDAEAVEDNAQDAAGVDHSTAGAQILYEHLYGPAPADRIAAEILALVVASHHSGLIDCLSPSGENRLLRRLSKGQEQTRKDEAWANLDDELRTRLLALLSSGVGTMLRSAIQAAVEPGRDGEHEVRFKIGLIARFLLSALIDADRLDTADFENPGFPQYRNYGCYVSWSRLIELLEDHLSSLPGDRPIDGIRRRVSDQCVRAARGGRGIYRLSVPTGGGKTLASLRFALYHAREHCLDRIIYVLPYTTIIDQNADIVRRILDPGSLSEGPSAIVLEHHSNLTPEVELTLQHRLLAENWDAPIVFTTMVQFLETLFGFGTRGCRRMHQLARAVIILDEIQTLPVRTVHLFNVALRFLVRSAGSTALLCTATQPLLDEVKPASRGLPPPTEIIQDVRQLYRDLQRVRVEDGTRPAGWTAGEVADLALRASEKHGSVLVILNTKRAAAMVFKEIQARGYPRVFHLSTNMCPEHRMTVLERVRTSLSGKGPLICVSTQLIEAGVDIDFPVVIRSLAGLDSVAQAAGRCNRHKERDIGIVVVINPSFEHFDTLTDIAKGRLAAERVLSEFSRDPASFEGDVLGPEALRRYFQYYFHERSGEMDYKVTETSPVGRRDSLYDLLSANPSSVGEHERVHGTAPDIYMRQSFMSAARAFAAIDQAGQGVIVPYKEGRDIIDALCREPDFVEQRRLVRRAQRYSVSLHPLEVRRYAGGRSPLIRETHMGSGVLYLADSRHYDEDLGFSAGTAEPQLMATLMA